MQSVLLPILGGVLIGLGASVLLLFNGQIAGISGIFASVLHEPEEGEIRWRAFFLTGLLLAGIAAAFGWPAALAGGVPRSTLAVGSAGFMVGLGTRFANGCTSGHGVCGIGRLSRRSVVATLTFMATGAATAIAVHQLLGGAL